MIGAMSSVPRAPHSRTRRLRRASLLLAVSTIATGACGEDDPAPDAAGSGAVRVVEIEATEYSFSGDPSASITAGDTVQFVVTNVGELTHEMQVLNADGRVLDRTAEIPPGGRDDVTVTFDEPGVYQVICDIDDHLTRGQRAQFDVAES